MHNTLPTTIASIHAPPLKCQGIKTKLVPFILSNVVWRSGSRGRWVEPFLGSGVVVLNLRPERALLCDTNPHIIRFYRAIQAGEISAEGARTYLEQAGRELAKKADEYYYCVRERFNAQGSPYDFLFLNRACFNGLMRFNRQGRFNVPFCRKPGRFSPAYITKITNQINWVSTAMRGRDWEFRVAAWEQTLGETEEDDFVYADPPYIGRHGDYYNTWGAREARNLAAAVRCLPCGFAVSMWQENRYRVNSHVEEDFGGLEVRHFNHFYHLGATEALRNEMREALIIKPGFAAVLSPPPESQRPHSRRSAQAAFAL